MVRLVDGRVCMAVGFGLCAWAMHLGIHVTADWGFHEFLGLQILRSIGSIMAMVAAQQMSVSTISIMQMKDAAGLLNLIRNVGGAVGLALMSTIMSHQTAVHLMDLSSRMSVANPAGTEMLDGLTVMMNQATDPAGAARKMLSLLLRRDASVLAFGDAFAFMAICCLVAASLSVFASRGAPGRVVQPGESH